MMTFLAWVTVIYAVVLVLVLAVSLITILYYLWSIGTTLSKIRAGLETVRDQTASLNGDIDAINGALGTAAAGFTGALEDLAKTNDALGMVLGETEPVAARRTA